MHLVRDKHDSGSDNWLGTKCIIAYQWAGCVIISRRGIKNTVWVLCSDLKPHCVTLKLFSNKHKDIDILQHNNLIQKQTTRIKTWHLHIKDSKLEWKTTSAEWLFGHSWTYLTGQSPPVEQENVELHAVTGRQSLLQQRGELFRELLPVLLPHLVLETMQDLNQKRPHYIWRGLTNICISSIS